MTATTLDNRGGGGKILLLFLVIIIIFAISIGIGSLLDLPMTQHAAQGRSDASLDADAIRRMIDNRACKPIEVWVCPPARQSKMLCYLRPSSNYSGDDTWAGVIIGIDEPHRIITGYVAPRSYWEGTFIRDGCWMASRID